MSGENYISWRDEHLSVSRVLLHVLFAAPFCWTWLHAKRGRRLTKTVYSEKLNFEIICRGGVPPSTDSKFIGG